MGSSNYAKWIHSVTFGSPELYAAWYADELEPYEGPIPAYEGVFNTWDDWKLVPLSRPVIAPPSFEPNFVETTQTDGQINLTNRLYETYGEQSGSMEFAIMNAKIPDRYNTNWIKSRSVIMAFLHNKKRFVVLDDDPEKTPFYGRFQVSFGSIEGHSTVKIDYLIYDTLHTK